MILIAGLGNPGSRYALTRHNIGFLAADRIAAAAGIMLNQKRHYSLMGSGVFSGNDVIIAKPQTYMNLAGTAIAALAEAYAIRSEDIIVLHDDMDIPFGTLKIKLNGGAGGHRGLISTIEHLATDAFLRLRIGIGRPPEQSLAADYVLQPFTQEERPQVEAVANTACECLKTILTDGASAAMNRFHAPPDTKQRPTVTDE